MANGQVELIELRGKWADLYFHRKKNNLKKLNVKFLEIMNQINQRNELCIIPFFFSLSGHLLLVDYLCYKYTYKGKKQTNQKT